MNNKRITILYLIPLFTAFLISSTIHADSIVPGRIFPMGDSTWRFIHHAMVANPPTGFTVKPADDTEYNVRWYGGSRLEHWNGYVSTEAAYWGDACAYPFKSLADGGGWLLFDLETPGESFTFYPCIQASDAEIFLVSVGWNNLSWNGFEGEWLNLDTLAAGFITFFEKLRTDFPGCTVIFLSEYPGCIDGCVDSSGNPSTFGEFSHDTECTPVCSAPNGFAMNARMASLIDKLKGLCAVENIPVLDAFTAVRNYYNDDTDQLADTYFKDGLHLRDQAGGTFYYETFVRPLLMEVLNPPTTTTTMMIVDTDQDGIVDSQDNCPTKCNIQQLDADGDGIGDVCDPDPGCGGCNQPQCEQECSLSTTTTTPQ